MATAEELLGTIADVTDEFLEVNLDTRIIAIPASIKVLGVESDDDVKQLRFKLPKTYGDFDLSTFSIQVNFENADGEGDFYPINDLTVQEDGTMTFTWLVDRHAFKRYGEVDFSLCMKKFDDVGVVVKELNTAIATLPVLKGLETTQAVVENNASAFDAVLFRLYAVEAATGNSANGYYTIVTINETDEGTELTIFGNDGERIAMVRHGYDPVRGVDYWTEEDVNEIKTESKDYINSLVPKGVLVSLPADAWDPNSKTQIVSVEGITSDTIVVIAPDPDKQNREVYDEYAIVCISQAEDQLKFECGDIPESDVLVNIGLFYTVKAE